MTRKNWIAIASAEHVRIGRAQGFMQICHGKATPLRRLSPGDTVAYTLRPDVPRQGPTASVHCDRHRVAGSALSGGHGWRLPPVPPGGAVEGGARYSRAPAPRPTRFRTRQQELEPSAPVWTVRNCERGHADYCIGNASRPERPPPMSASVTGSVSDLQQLWRGVTLGSFGSENFALRECNDQRGIHLNSTSEASMSQEPISSRPYHSISWTRNGWDASCRTDNLGSRSRSRTALRAAIRGAVARMHARGVETEGTADMGPSQL
jgi:hypothetical protein